MEFIYRRSYAGPLRGIIFDWAGTTVDYGCFAPVAVFVEIFKARGVAITIEQARAPMGMAKKDHIRAIAQMESVAGAWQSVHRRAASEDDIEALFQTSVDLQRRCVLDYPDLIPGTRDTVALCRARGMRIGSTTGYSRQIMDALAPEVAERGYAPDAIVCANEVVAGRPAPWMALQAAQQLQVYPPAALVKVGDTIPDIEEGLNAGMWTIGLSRTGNELGLSEAAALAPNDLATRLERIERRMRQAGAHYVVESIVDAPPILDAIEARLRQGEQP